MVQSYISLVQVQQSAIHAYILQELGNILFKENPKLVTTRLNWFTLKFPCTVSSLYEEEFTSLRCC